MIGKKFGRLLVQKECPDSTVKHKKWICLCNCGTIKKVRQDHLKSGASLSCGCLKLENLTSHGKHNSRVYSIWEGIQQRCNNPKHAAYHNYGGRGIRCHFKSFEEFYLAIGDIPVGFEVDRIQGDGHYEHGNIRLATRNQNSANKKKPNNCCTSKYKGVWYDKKSSKFHAGITKDGKKKFLGSFPNEWEAAEAYNTAAISYFGQFAFLNKKEL